MPNQALLRRDFRYSCVLLDAEELRANHLSEVLSGAGWRVIRTGCIVSALDLCILESIDLLLISEAFPSAISSKRFFRIIEETPQLRNLGVIVIGSSALGENNSRKSCYRLLANGPNITYLPASFTAAQLVSLASKAIPAQATLAGDFKLITLFDLLQLTLSLRLSGELQIQTEKDQAFLALLQGEVIDAEWNGLSGEAALRRLLSGAAELKRFTLYDLVCSERHTMTIKTASLLLETASALDERKQQTSRSTLT